MTLPNEVHSSAGPKGKPMKPRRFFTKWLAILAVLAITAAACGNDDDAPAQSEPDPAAATSAPEPEPGARTRAHRST